MEEGLLPDLQYHGAEIGTDGKLWTVTFWVMQEVTLRLKIRHYSWEFEDEFSDDYVWPLEPATVELFPVTYRSAFMAMVRH